MMAVAALPRLWATAAQMDEPYRARCLGRNREGGERLRVGIKVETAGFACLFWAELAAVITTVDPTTNLAGYRPNAFPFCPSDDGRPP